MKRGLILSGLIFICFFLIISCEENATAPSIDEGNAGDTKDSETPAEVSDKVMQIFALDENLEPVSFKVFEDLNSIKIILNNKYVDEMESEPLSIIEDYFKVYKVREMLFSDLEISEYMNIKKILSLQMEGVLLPGGGTSVGCLKSCAKRFPYDKEKFGACVLGCSEKDKHKPHKDW